jgi:PTS system sucrose-specific IIC component
MAKKDNKKDIVLSESIIKLVGGKANIDSLRNCMTRCRMTLKDQSKAKDAEIKKLDGVMGLVKDAEYQIVIGLGRAKRIADLIKSNLEGNVDKKIEKSKTTNAATKETKGLD